jgi:ABC-type phosphate transport system substrate-binding protein
MTKVKGEHMSRKWLLAAALSGALAIGVSACGGDDGDDSGTGSSGNGAGKVSGTITIDGSSTVFRFAQAAGELF